MTSEHFSIGLLCAAEPVLLILTLFLWSRRSSESDRFLPFRRFVTFNTASCAVEIGYSALINHHYSMPGVFYQSLFALNLILGTLATCSFYLYFIQFLDIPDRTRRFLRTIRYLVLMLLSAILAVGFVTGDVVVFNTVGRSVRGGLYDLATYVLPMSFIIMMIVLAIRYRKQLKRDNLAAFGAVTLFSLAVYPVQMAFFPDVVMEYFILALFAVVMFFSLETPALNQLVNTGERMEEARNRAEASTKAAVSAARAKQDFLSSMSHEIRTPMNAIIGMNDMILRETASSSTRQYAEEIGESGRHLLHVINDILDYSRMESGKMEVRQEAYHLADLLDALYGDVKKEAEKKKLSLVFDVDQSLPDLLEGDGQRTSQVLLNLLTNAIKYTERGSVRLTVNGVRREGFVTLFLKVADTGIGMKKENLGEIFDSFSRVNIERNRSILGTGLGLAITRDLVAKMGGDISVRSEENEGSVFTVRLLQRILSGETIASRRERAEENGAGAEDSFADGARVLIVDDNPINLRVASLLLKTIGIRADTAASGGACLKAAEDKHYDIIFLDHLMPEMDGEETLRALFARKSFDHTRTKVVCLSAADGPDIRTMFLQMGFDDFLSKPIDLERMKMLLKQYVPGEAEYAV